MLTQLGYAPQFFCLSTADQSITFNALPLLCLLKVYADWYFPSQYQDNPLLAQINSILTHDEQGYILDFNDLSLISYVPLFVYYDGDYFTSAFDNPVGPSSGNYTNITLDDATVTNAYSRTQLQTANNGTPIINGQTTQGATNASPYNLSQYMLDALHRVSDYMKRHQLAGARALDRYLARFGVSLPAEKLNRSIYLGNHEVPLMTGDVMATADSQGNYPSVGSYSGKGYVAGDDGRFEFETTEYGMFLLLHSFVPHVGYYQGTDRHNMYKDKLDLYTPEFDGIGNRAIAKSELYVPLQEDAQSRIDSFTSLYDGIFGHIPQYAEDKVGKDIVSGDFRLGTRKSVGIASDSWHLMRDVSNDWSRSADIVHSIDFIHAINDYDDYDRIFQYTSPDLADHFSCHFFFGITKFSRALPLYDNYDFLEDAKQVNLHINGSKLD